LKVAGIIKEYDAQHKMSNVECYPPLKKQVDDISWLVVTYMGELNNLIVVSISLNNGYRRNNPERDTYISICSDFGANFPGQSLKMTGSIPLQSG